MYMLIQMYRFTIRGVQKSKTQPSVLVPSFYTFGHKDSQTCQIWVNRINDLLNMDAERPKNLLVCLASYPYQLTCLLVAQALVVPILSKW